MQPNLLDLLELLVFIAIIYRGQISGFLNELFKLISVLCAVVFATHYYVSFGSLLAKTLVYIKPSENFLAFSLLAAGFSLICPLIYNGWVALMNVDPKPPARSWLNIGLASLRAYLTCGMIFFAVVLYNNEYLTTTAKTSVSKVIFKDTCVNVYQLAYHGFIKRIFNSEILNLDSVNMVDKTFSLLQSGKDTVDGTK